MARYVDLDKVTVWRCPHNIAQMREWAFGLPVEDVKPVVHAHWIRTNHGAYRCSNCTEKYGKLYGVFLHAHQFDYCPECSARMDEEVE